LVYIIQRPYWSNCNWIRFRCTYQNRCCFINCRRIIYECMYSKCTIQYNTIQYNTIQHNTIQFNIIQYNTTQHTSLTMFLYVSKQQQFLHLSGLFQRQSVLNSLENRKMLCTTRQCMSWESGWVLVRFLRWIKISWGVCWCMFVRICVVHLLFELLLDHNIGMLCVVLYCTVLYSVVLCCSVKYCVLSNFIPLELTWNLCLI